MNIPDWYELVLLGLAAWRIFQLIAEDTILDGPRRYVTARLDPKWELFIECPYCAGFWIWVAWLTAWWIDERVLYAAVVFGGHALVVAAAKVLSSD